MDDELECFLFSGNYGNLNANWPHRTVMVFRSTINGTPGVYQVIHNDPQNDHAEIIFINQVNIPPEATEIEIEMFISYSPCNTCADALIVWINNLTMQVSIAIKFFSFYKNETRGLILLSQVDGITLDVFRGEEAWEIFFQCIRRTDFTKYKKRIRKRKDREDVDDTKLQGII